MRQTLCIETFYTMPNTSNPNNQTEFAKWLYDRGPTKNKILVSVIKLYLIDYKCEHL